MTSSHGADSGVKSNTSSDLSFLDGLGVPALEVSRSHTPPERDTTSKQLTVMASSEVVQSLQGYCFIYLFFGLFFGKML